MGVHYTQQKVCSVGVHSILSWATGLKYGWLHITLFFVEVIKHVIYVIFPVQCGCRVWAFVCSDVTAALQRCESSTYFCNFLTWDLLLDMAQMPSRSITHIIDIYGQFH